MATGTAITTTTLTALTQQLVQETEEIRLQTEDESTCVKNENFPGDYSMGCLKGLKMQLESEIEALQETPLVQLPSESGPLLGLAIEEAQKTAHANARTLEFYKKKLKERKEKRDKYKMMVKKATLVNETLDKLHSQHFTEEEKMIALQRKHNRKSVVFRFLRSELHYILETLYPEDISTPESVKSMEDLLDSLVSRMISNPSDPYVVMDETMQEAHVTLLMCANLIARHPTDITRIKFINPTV